MQYVSQIKQFIFSSSVLVNAVSIDPTFSTRTLLENNLHIYDERKENTTPFHFRGEYFGLAGMWVKLLSSYDMSIPCAVAVSMSDFLKMIIRMSLCRYTRPDFELMKLQGNQFKAFLQASQSNFTEFLLILLEFHCLFIHFC